MKNTWIEIIGWSSTVAFLVSIVLPQRRNLHAWGMFTAVTTFVYSYCYGAVAIYVKWFIAFFFHAHMWWKLRRTSATVSGDGVQ